jgi:hypothetical protein
MQTSIPAPLFLAPFLAGTAGCLLLLAAGRRYVRGRLEPARRLGRRAGWILLAGDGLLGLLAAGAALGRPPAPSWTGLAGAVLLLAAGAVGLLGGLSGKPRPADGFAALLHAAGAGCLFVAA